VPTPTPSTQGNLHFAGEYISNDGQGYIEGGAVEGLRAANEIYTYAK
jgi:monoamine oxidase